MKRLQQVVVGVMLSLLLFNSGGWASETKNFSIQPTTKHEPKWRIGYYEGGEYKDYQRCLVAIVNSLMELGWIDPTEIPLQSGIQTRELWTWLATKSKSSYLEFVENAHYTANWDETLRVQMSADIVKRLNEVNDVDLMIAAGTWAGQDLANDRHHIPTMVISTSNPLASGIIKSIEDSGYSHIHARVDPFRNERQIQLFWKIIGFQKLGVVYEDTVEGRSHAAIDEVEKVAHERKFEIVRCYTAHDDKNPHVAEESIKGCFQELSKQADAIYATVQPYITNPERVSEWAQIANAARLPTFSQSGSEEVKFGFLMSISIADFKYVGRFWAETIGKILNGAKPQELDQIFENPPKIAINLKTAEMIGYYPPVEILRTADEIYQEISAVPQRNALVK